MSAPTAELSEVRALAQKLFAQCKGRDAPSSYKLLATSVRSLRNALEEVEEDYDQTRTLGPDDVKLLNQIGRSHDILGRLDLALQSYKCSTHKDVNMNAVSDMKTALDVTTHQLRVAFEATTTGEIPLKLDTRDFPDHARASASIEDSSASRSRKSSMWSLGQRDSARSPGASDATSVHNERPERYSGEEKQVLSPSASSASDARASMDFRAPFADPLSMGIEDATSFILGGDDDDFKMSAYARPVSSRSRAESNVSTATETFVSAPVSPDLERKPSAPRDQPPSANESVAPAIDAEKANTQYSSDGNSSEHADQHPEGRRESEVKAEESHLSPETATRELALKRTRTNSNASVTESTKPDVETSTAAASESDAVSTVSEKTISRPGTSHQTTAGAETFSGSKSQEEPPSPPMPPASAPLPPISSPPATQETRTRSLPVGVAHDTQPAHHLEAEADDFVKDLSKSIERAFDGNEPRPQSQASVDSPPAASLDQQETKSPPAPARRPPPPPPMIRRSNANVKLKSTQSKYRITNDAPDDSSSEDELYSTSRPASPAKNKSPVPVQSPPVATPTIQIDQSALDDSQEKKGTDALLDNVKDQEASETSDDGPQLPQSVYRPPSTSKAPIFARSKSSESSDEQRPSPVTETKPPQSPPAPQSPPSQRNSSRPLSSQSSQSSPPPRSPPLPPSVQKRVDAAVRAGDKLLAKEIEARFQQEGKPPPVPPRPPKSRYNNRPRATTTNSSPATIAEKEISIPEPGLELDDKLLATNPKNPRLVPRISVDHALNVAGTDSPQAPEPAESLDVTRHARSASTSQLPPPQFSARSSHPSGVNGHRLTGWYGPGADDTSQSALDAERIEHIEHFWNSMDWDRAGEYLMGYLESLIEQDNIAMVRRIRHLLGVAATYKGDIQHAIALFLSVLEFSEPADLSKPGNCEACYWLGDLYAMSNLRDEALLAYCAAQWGGVFNDPDEPNLTDLVKAEQEAVQLGSPKSEFQARWSQEAKEGCGTILDPTILPPAVVKHLFETEPRRDARSMPFEKAFSLDPNKPRSSALFSLSTSPQWAKFRRNKISSFHFLPSGPWPLQYDPTFTLANVKRERLLGFECDLLSVLQGKDGEAKIPKTAPMSLSKMDCFTCNDLAWLITSVRDCLRMLEMEWSEVANEQGVWFVVRNTLMDGPSKLATMKIATVHYFAISLFRQTFRTSYGVEICSYGVSSARIMEPSNLEYERGVHHTEPRRIRKLIRETLEEADKKRPKTRKRVSSVGLGLSRASSSDDQPAKVDRGNAPPVPPRLSKS